jgi:hypothetical protein
MLPYFLCIGAQKAGTTWLYDNIVQHPQVWMAPVKEIFYFDRPTWLPLAVQLAQPANRALRRHTFEAMGKRFRPKAGRPLATAPAAGATGQRGAPGMSRMAKALWHLRFMFWPRTDRWYASLFRPAKGQLAGDINPYLAQLDTPTIARIHRLMPQARIVYLLRNPVERLWSQVGMSMREVGVESLAAIDPNLLRRSLEVGSGARLSDYMGNLLRWGTFYRQEQIFVGFFDDLQADYRFLGIDARAIPASVRAKSNPGSGPDIPLQYLQLLSERLLPQLEALHAHFDHAHTGKWLQDARAVLQGQSAG